MDQLGQVGRVGRVREVREARRVPGVPRVPRVPRVRVPQVPSAAMGTVLETTATDDTRWEAVMRRDRRADGQFVYAVTSTRVFCRPSCPSRRPSRDRVTFFHTTSAAEHAGFRACRRCRPASVDRAPSTSDAIERASQYLTQHAEEPVSLKVLAGIARLSPSYFQRQFTRALGLSPREYQAACRANRFRRALRTGRDVTSAMYEAGYGSPSRIYEASPTGGIPPATYRRGGAGAHVRFTTIRCELGWLLVAATDRGVCAVKLGDSASTLVDDLRRELPLAQVSRDEISREWVAGVVNRLKGPGREPDLPLDVRGTAFQWRVWRALQQIPFGETRSYSDVARDIGHPSAVRAVARACATNPVCLVVPCHRVVAKDGGLGGYRWGTSRKIRLLTREAKLCKPAPRRSGKPK